MIDPNLSANQDWRVEFQLHNWAAPSVNTNGGFIWDLNGIGSNAAIVPGNLLWINDKRDSIAGGSPCQLPLAGRTDVLVRAQRESSQSRFVCEIWNIDGTNYSKDIVAIQSANPWLYSGGIFGSPYTTADLGFFRIFLTTLPDSSRPPVTADTGSWTDLRFDGTVADDSGNGHNLTFPGASYMPTPSQLPAAIIKTLGAPTWSSVVTARAGFPTALDGTNSLSMADGSSSLTYFWQQISGPTTVIWSSRTAAQPVITGLIFGDYQFRLQVTDTAGLTAVTDVHVGAVATDNNGVVVNANPMVDAIYGPMIAFGKSPWAYIDYSQQLLSNYWTQNYDVNGGTWSLESDLPSLGGVPRNGTVYVAGGATDVYGIGTNFLAVFCGGTPGPATGTNPYIVPHMNAGTNVPYYSYPRIVASCVSDTHVVLTDGWYWDRAPIPSPGVPWGTYNICPVNTCGNWQGANNTTSNLNYYDHAAGNYAYYYRSGLSAPKAAAEWMADRWVHAPYIGYGPPRDLELVGQMIRAGLDPPATTQLWPAIRNWLGHCDNNHVISDPREDGFCLVYYATAALLDTGANQTNALNWLVAAYTNMWGPQQQPNGAYITDEFEGDGAHSFAAANGSTAMTLHTGSTLPANYCGEDVIQTAAGSIAIGGDNIRVTGTGTSFLGSAVKPGMVIAMTGTIDNGKPWSMLANVAAVNSDTSLSLAQPWRGDNPTTITGYRIYNGSLNNTGYYTQSFGVVDVNGNLPTTPVPDTDNWYWCKVTAGGAGITLDKPYTGNTSGGNIYRRLTTYNAPGRGTQPYMMGITGWGLNLASTALTSYAPAIATQYKASANAAAGWIFNTALDPITGGLPYAMGFSDCQALKYPSFGCSGDYAAQERDYAVEVDNYASLHYLSTRANADRTNMDTFFNNQYAVSGFTSPFGPGDGNQVDLLACCNQFTLTKYYGQVFSVGQAYQWPAARLGGVQPPYPYSASINFDLAAAPNAVSAQIVVTQPSSAQTTVSCSSSPCQITLDRRQGGHWIQIQYLDGAGKVVSQSDPQLIQTQNQRP